MVRELNECRDGEIKDGRISNAIWRQLTVDEYWLVLGKKATAFLSFCLVLFGATGCLFLVGSVRRCSSDADYAGGTKGRPIE